jgi:hypothetical protein
VDLHGMMDLVAASLAMASFHDFAALAGFSTDLEWFERLYSQLSG